MEFDLLDDEENVEHNDIGFVEISNSFAMRTNIYVDGVTLFLRVETFTLSLRLTQSFFKALETIVTNCC